MSDGSFTQCIFEYPQMWLQRCLIVAWLVTHETVIAAYCQRVHKKCCRVLTLFGWRLSLGHLLEVMVVGQDLGQKVNLQVLGLHTVKRNQSSRQVSNLSTNPSNTTVQSNRKSIDQSTNPSKVGHQMICQPVHQR